MNKKISIIIPTMANRFEDLNNCLKSIYNSTYTNFEVIVINNTGDLNYPNKILQKFPQIKIIEMTKNTAIYGFNIGFANSEGDYILGIDDDCTLRKDTLINAVNVFEKLSSDVMILTAYVYNPILKKYIDENSKNQTNRLSFSDGASFYRKDLFYQVGFFDEDFFCWQHSDDLAIRTLKKGYRIYFDKSVIINHHDKVNYKLRINRSFYDPRNSVYVIIKNFSLIFWPILILRNFISIIRMPIRQRHILALLIGLAGYTVGWLTFFIPLKKRNIPSISLQFKFLKYYLSNKHPQNY